MLLGRKMYPKALWTTIILINFPHLTGGCECYNEGEGAVLTSKVSNLKETRVMVFFHQESIKLVLIIVAPLCSSFVTLISSASSFFFLHRSWFRRKTKDVEQYLCNEFEMMLGVNGRRQPNRNKTKKGLYYPFVFSFLYVIIGRSKHSNILSILYKVKRMSFSFNGPFHKLQPLLFEEGSSSPLHLTPFLPVCTNIFRFRILCESKPGKQIWFRETVNIHFLNFISIYWGFLVNCTMFYIVKWLGW